MGNWHIGIHGVGSHHNQDNPHDVNKLAAEFVDKLKAAGHSVTHAHLHHGGAEDMLDEKAATRAGAFGPLAAAGAAAAATGLALLLAAFAWNAPVRAANLDLPTKAPPPTVYGDPWSGFYVGAHGGYGLDRGGGTVCCDPNGLASDFKTAPQGFIGGLHAGYMWHLPGSGFVAGFEGDGDIATLDGTLNNPGFVGSANSKNRWLASLRGRLGYVVAPHAVVYATGGWGWGSNEFTVQAVNGQTANTASLSATKGGAVLGAGLEVAFTGNWLGRAEYLHYFLEDTNVDMGGGNFLRASDNVSVFRGGLTYKFSF